MKIDSVTFRLPSKQVGNQEILANIRHFSKNSYTEDLEELQAAVNENFINAGIETRYRYGEKEPWYPLVKQTVMDALDQAGCRPNDVGCIIYCSVYRTVFEPSMAALLAKSFSMDRAMAFDVNEACAGWARAVAIAQHFFKGGFQKKILIVSNEASNREKSLTHNAFKLTKKSDLEWAFPSYTIGAAATATLLSREDSQEWFMDFAADNTLSDYCLLPQSMTDACEHQVGDVDTRGEGIGLFTCYGRKLQANGFKKFVHFLDKSKHLAQAADIIFPHTHSYNTFTVLFRMLKCDRPLYSLFPKYGNIITSSLPGSVADAFEQGVLKRGDRVYMAIPASGLSMAALSFVF